jgi:hypothetical protein
MRHLRLAGVRGVRIVREHLTHGPPGRPNAAEADVGRRARHVGDVEDSRIVDGLITFLAWPRSRAVPPPGAEGDGVT